MDQSTKSSFTVSSFFDLPTFPDPRTQSSPMLVAKLHLLGYVPSTLTAKPTGADSFVHAAYGTAAAVGPGSSDVGLPVTIRLHLVKQFKNIPAHRQRKAGDTRWEGWKAGNEGLVDRLIYVIATR